MQEDTRVAVEGLRERTSATAGTLARHLDDCREAQLETRKAIGRVHQRIDRLVWGVMAAAVAAAGTLLMTLLMLLLGVRG